MDWNEVKLSAHVAIEKVAPQLPGDQQPDFVKFVEGIEAAVGETAAEMAALDHKDFTPEGIRKRKQAVAQRTLDALDRADADTRKLRERADAAERTAGDGLTLAGRAGTFVRTKPRERGAVELLEEREIRDRLFAMTPSERRQAYLGAVRSGDDPALVAAVERAPKIKPVLDEATIAEARNLRVQQSPWAEPLHGWRRQAEWRDNVVRKAREVLGRAVRG